MLRWAIFFLVIAIIAAIFGFGDIATAVIEAARFLFFLFIGIFVILFFISLVSSRRPPPRE